VGATLTAFLAKPEAFLNVAQGVSQTVAESAVRPLAEAPGKAVVGCCQEHELDRGVQCGRAGAGWLRHPALASALTACEQSHIPGFDGR